MSADLRCFGCGEAATRIATLKANPMAGTHMGTLDAEARERRRRKNARNAQRSGEATRPPGSARRVTSRLETKGNRLARRGSR